MRRLPSPLVAAAFSALLAVAALSPAIADGRHTVAPGDTLSYIAGLYGISVELLAEVNHIVDPDLILVGQVLDIVDGDDGADATAGARTYQVQAGDTLSGISRQFGVSIAALAEANGLTDPDLIVIGQTLTIPASAAPDLIDYLPATPPSDLELEAIIDDLSIAYGVDPRLVRALAWVESGWRQDARSPVGAVGVMQIMPDTAAWLESDVFGYALNEDVSVYDNVKAGVKLLRILLDATGSTEQALASYYQGQGATLSGIMYEDTHAYVRTVLIVKQRL